MSLTGGLLTIDLHGGLEAGQPLRGGDRVAQLATSLGGPETLVTHPASTTHVSLTPEELAANGIGPGTVRVSVGLEHGDDVVADFAQALAVAARLTGRPAAGGRRPRVGRSAQFSLRVGARIDR